MVPSAAPDGVDRQGRCVHHPFVQLQRLSHRTGEWKALLDSCPLCAMDDKSVASSYGGSVCASVFSSGADDNPPMCSPCAPAPEEQCGRGRSLSRPLASSASLEDQLVSLTSRPRSTSRVRFSDGESDLEDSGREGGNIFLGRQTSSSSLPAGMAGDQSLSGLSCNGGVITVNGGLCSGSSVASGSSQQLTKGVLKALPKYKACRVKMQRQASEIEKVTTMSMDLSINCDLNFDANHGDEEELDYDEDEAELNYDEVEVDYANQDGEDETFVAEEKEEFKPQKIGRSKVNRRLEQMQLPDLYQLAQDEEQDDAAASEEESEAESQQNHNKMTTINHGSSSSRRNSSSRGGTQQLSSRTNSSGSSSRRPGSTERSSSRKNDLYKMAQDHEEYASASEEESETASRQVEQKKMTAKSRGSSSKSRGSTKQLSSRTNSSGSGSRTDHTSSSRKHRSSERGSSSRSTERAGNDKNSKKQSKRRSASLQAQDVARPDPEEFPCNTSRSSRSPGSGSRGSHSHQRRPSSRRQAKRSSSFGSAEQRYGNIPPPPPPPPPQQSPGQQFNVSNMNVASMQMLQPTIRQPCHTNMVVNPSPNYDDEVSTLSFMGGSVGTGTIASREPSLNDSTNNNQEPKSKQSYGQDTSPSDNESDYEDAVHPEPLLANSMINTNDYDSKGRCLHHQHIRLRKKKMFGRGWKVLMSACPDCCVDELRRIRAVEENNRRRTNPRRERSDRSERSSCGGSGGGGMDGSHRSGTDGEAGRRSSARSVGSNHSNSQHNQEQQLRSSVRSVGSSHGGSFATPKMSGAVPPHPPPRTQKRSPSQDSFRPPSRSPSQESRRSAPAPPTATQMTRRCPSQDSFRAASVSLTTAHRARRSPSRGSFNAGVDKDCRSSSRQSSDDVTASMTSDEQDCSNPSGVAQPMPNLEQVELSLHRNQGTGSKKRSSLRIKSRAQQDLSRSPSYSQPQPLQQPQGQQRGTIHVRQMQWTDADGQAGTYTGQVNDRFVPHGRGTVEYASGRSREGEWKNGRFRKSKGGGSSCADERGASNGSCGNDGSRSESREEGRSRSRSRGATGRRSSSRSRQQQSMPAAA